MAYHWRWLFKWVHKHQLIWWKCFPGDRLEWFVSETQHFPIYVHLQAGAYRWIMFSEYKLGCSPISRVASCWGLTVLYIYTIYMYINMLCKEGMYMYPPLYSHYEGKLFSFIHCFKWCWTLGLFCVGLQDFRHLLVDTGWVVQKLVVKSYLS